MVNWGCTKLDTTTLGSDLIPAVDNVNTFADTFSINTTQGIFNDTFKITSASNNLLGTINGDELFGNSTAHMFFQVKPSFYPYYFASAGDTILPGVDSVVLCLNYVGFWGDSITPQTLKVFKINDKPFADSPYNYRYISYQPTIAGEIGSATFDIRKLAKDTIRLRNDSVTKQIRIKLDASYANELFGSDTAAASATNYFRSDSLYRNKFNGLAVQAQAGGNALMYISLSDARTRLEVHYRCKRKTTGKLDTTVSYINVNTNTFGTTLPSATCNYIHRDYSPSVTSPSFNNLYLVTGPGTYANLTIPALDTLSNKIVHRAEIYFEQDPDAAGGLDDSIFSAPSYMYMDLKDTGTTKWKPLYVDLNPSTFYDPDNKTAGYPYYPGTVDNSYFGGFLRSRVNEAGQRVNYYTINITRHVQRIVTKGTPNYAFRLFPAYSFIYPQYTNAQGIAYNNPLAYGRIRIKSGSYAPDPRLRMRMVIIWSKI